MDIFDEIVDLQKRGERAIVATVISTKGSVPRKAGARMLVKPGGEISGTVGGGSLEHKVRAAALDHMDIEEPRLMHFELTNDDAGREGMLCGGTVDVFIEPIKPALSLLIFGGGHISFSLARIGKMLGFRVVVIDDRPEYANPERFPEADKTIAEDLESAKGKLELNPASYIVIVTRGHLNDAAVLEWAVTTKAGYIGMIGSKRKVKTVFEHMESKGITREQLARVHSPIGLSIGAETPEEIAVSIMAEIIQERRNSGTPKPVK